MSGRGSKILRIFGYLFGAGVVVAIALLLAGAYIIWDVSKDLPDYEQLSKYDPPVMTRVHAADGTLLAEYAHERRLFVPINAVPDRLKNAFLSAEDKNFYNHAGIDFNGVARAIVVNVKNLLQGKRRLVGASTITQQVAKNFLLTTDQTLERKLKEALLSQKIEKAYDKHKILELYLNEIYLGLGSYGVAAASLNYFGKNLHALELHEIAYLAALPKAPNNYHPFRKTERAITRRNWVISRMEENGYVSDEEAEAAKAKPLSVSPRSFGTQLFAADYFAEEIRRRLLDIYGEKKLYEGGLSVRTTLNPKLQVLARRALVNGLVKYDRSRGWRGAVGTLPLTGEWGEELGAIKAIDDISPWKLAVVIEVGDKSAEIGIQPKRLKNGKLEPERVKGSLSLEHVKWARSAPKDNKLGPLGDKISKVSDVLSPGDVIYVAPVLKSVKNKKGRVIEKLTVQGQWDLKQIPQVQGGIVAMDPHTGRVHALVGGFSYGQSQFNRAVQANRQPGSSFKPFVYVAALDNGYTPASVVMDAPIAVDQGNDQGIWRPQNFGREFFGPSTLRLGIEKSRNVMTVRLAQDMGMDNVVAYAKAFGIYDNLLAVPSMALGAGETTLLKMTNAYGILANGGKRITPTLIDRIQDRYGKTIYRHDKRECQTCKQEDWQGQEEPVLVDDREQIVDPLSAYQITSMMEGVVQRGTATKVGRIGKPLAGKTGTTNEEKDAWFVGFAPDLTVGVYIGYDKPQPMGRKATGGGLAAPIFTEFMQAALKGKPAVPFRVPPGINLVPINSKTGRLASLGDEGVILEAFKPGEEPPEETRIIGEADGWFGDAPDTDYDRPYYRSGAPNYEPRQDNPFSDPRTRRRLPGGYPDRSIAVPPERNLSTGTGGLY